MKKTGVLVMFLILTMLMARAVQADTVTVYSTTTFDGAVQIGGTGVWGAQNLHAGNEEHYLSGKLLAGVVKFQLPTLPDNIHITSISLVLQSDSRTDGTSLGLKAGDANYPNGPFFQLQHFTYDNNVVLCTADASDTGVENIGAPAAVSGSQIKTLDVTDAVLADMNSGHSYAGFRVKATDYTGRLLTTTDLTEFTGYLASFWSTEYSTYKPCLNINYTPISVIDVSAGQIQGIYPDTVSSVVESGYDHVRVFNNDSANKSYSWMLLDLGSAQYVAYFTMTNRLDGGLFNVAQAEVYVSSQENDENFDPLDVDNFTTCVFSGIPSPDSYAAGVERTIGVHANHRYFLFKIVSNYRGYYGLEGGRTYADFSDIAISNQVDVSIDVSAGQIQGIYPDTVSSVEESGYDHVRVVNNNSANKSYSWMLLDLGSAQYVASFTMTNRLDGGLFNVAQAEVYVSSQENNENFDPRDVDKFTTCVFSGIPSPDSYAAGVERTIGVNANRRYFLFKIVSNYRGYYGLEGDRIYADFADLAIVSQIDVAAGKVCGLDGDTVEPVTENGYTYFRAYNRNYPADTAEYLLLNMGQIRKVTSLMIANRCDNDSLYNVGQVQVYIAPDESATGFDAFSSSSYTQCVFSGLPLSANYSQGERRTLDITDTSRQYFMIKIVSNFQSYNGTGNNEYADFDDIRATPEPFMPIGWYDSATDPTYYINEMANGGTKVVLAYTTGASDETLATYLNTARSAGVKVILELPRASVNSQDVTSMATFIKAYRSYPALYGWYIKDEPSSSQYQMCKTAYDTIRENSSKPALICFCGVDDNPINFADAYDVFVYDYYACMQDDAELEGMAAFMTRFATVSSKAAQVDKPWWPVLQGIGQVSVATGTGDFRLPTLNESRFMTYYCLDKNASGYLNFYYGLCKMSIVHPENPYPYDGVQWLSDVPPVVFGEINTLAPALAAGRLSAGFVSDNSSSVNSSLWQDPDTGSYYLIAVNTSSTIGSVTFTLAMSGLGISEVQPLFENRQPASFSGNKFTDSFSSYQVHVYKLTFEAVTQITGDFNGDGLVNATDIDLLSAAIKTTNPDSKFDLTGEGSVNSADMDMLVKDILKTYYGDADLNHSVGVSDLSVLAAYYNTPSGASWANGDFDGNGAVGVSDLSILAANYNSGSASTISWAEAYAQAFGTTSDVAVDDASDEATADEEDTSSTVCSSLGLSLIAGLALMGLMMVKLEE
jgi:hypothetical protein